MEHIEPADLAILELIDAAAKSETSRQFAAAEQRLDLGDRMIGQLAAVSAIREAEAALGSDPTTAQPEAVS